MAAINLPNHNLAFVHIPKNGGSSVVKWLSDNIAPYERIKGHPSLSIMKEQWAINRSFAIVRNPWARIVSAYFYLKQYKFYWDKNGITSEENFPTWDYFVHHLNYNVDSWYDFSVNQIEWMSGETQIILRAEKLNDEFSIIQDILNCNAPLPYINTSEHDDYSVYYNSEQVKHIRKIFERDIDIFKYSFPK